MKLYFAGAESYYDVLRRAGARNIMISFFSFKGRKKKRLDEIMGKDNAEWFNIFLDSGAYSAWTKGEKIDVYELIDFIKINQRYLNLYAQLDDKNSDENTKRNLKIMEKAGLRPIPVYQRRMNDEKYLRYLCKNYDYIAVGGMAGEGLSWQKTIKILGRIALIAREYGTKIHAFGISGKKILEKVPVYSGDSTTWLVGSKYRRLFVFREGEIETFDKDNKKAEETLKCWKAHYSELCLKNIKETLKLENYLTKLWEKRGIKWD